MFSNTLDAQTQLISNIIARAPLDALLATYNNINDPSGPLRLALKVEIKNIQLIIDAANLYLSQNNIPILAYSASLVNTDGFVATPWSNEVQIPGTVAYNTAQMPVPSLTDLKASQTNLQSIATTLGQTIVSNRQAVASAQALDDTDPSKTVLLENAQQLLNVSQTSFDAIVQTQLALQNSITTSTATPINTIPDTFSQNVREDLHNLVSQKVGYNQSLNDDEAVVIMRKKALDAFYTAKTPGELQIATERLSRVAGAMNPNVPITRSTISFDPNAFFTLNTQLTTVDTELVAALATLSTAQQGGNPTIIAAAQAVVDGLNLQKANIIDTLLGFRDSSLTSAAYPGSLDITTTSGLNISALPLSTDSLATYQALVGASNPTQTPPTMYFDYQTNTYVSASNLSAQEVQSGRYTTTTNATPSNNEAYQTAITNAQYNTSINNANTALSALNSNYQTSSLAYQVSIQKNNEILSNPPASFTPDMLAALAQENAQTQASLNNLSNTYYSSAAPLQAQIAQAGASTLSANNSITNTTNQNTFPITDEQAQNLTQNLADTQAQSNNAQDTFNKAYYIAQTQATLDGSKTPNDPTTWTPQNLDAVSSAQANVNSTQANEVVAASNVSAYAQQDGGTQSLLQNGLSSTQIQSANAMAQSAVNNNNPPPQPNQAGFNNTANSTDASNVNPVNGFEGINGNSPFYMQFPTLKSITDFRFRNGISPYGQQSPNEIARNAIHFNIFEYTPPAPSAQLVPGSSGLIQNVVVPATNNTVGSFTIYPSEQEIRQTHTHSFANTDALASLANDALEIIDGVDTVFSAAATLVKDVVAGKDLGTAQQLSQHVEAIDRYKGTDKQSMSVDFNLFTKNNFIQDIFRPLMFLTALSYPKRSLTSNFGNSIKKMGGAVTQLGAQPGTVGSATSTVADTLTALVKKFDPNYSAQQAADVVNKIQTNISSLGGFGPYRYFITKNPEYISVRHASGLFYYPLAVIQSVSYSFQGPWYNYAGDIIVPNGNLDAVLGSSIELAQTQSLDDVFNDFVNGTSSAGGPVGPPGTLSYLASQDANSNFISKYQLPAAYPSWASCNITFKAAVSLFRDDYMNLFYQAGGPNGESQIISVSQQQTSTTKGNQQRIF